jgi:hypothetical protein
MADDSKMSSPPEIDETPTKQDESMEGGKRSAWMVHVMKTKRAHKGKSLAQVLKMAAKTYKKSGKKTARKTRKGKKFMGMFGGGVAETAAMVGGRRRRGSRKH